MYLKIKKKIFWFLINLGYVFRVTKPILLLRIIKNFLWMPFTGKPLLRYVDLAIGYKCNLSCEHCFATGLVEEKRRIMTAGEYSNVAHQAMSLGAVNFSFQGGEPLLYEELENYIRAAEPSQNLISVTTNGTLLDEATLEKLKKWGVDVLTVSLDSGIPEEHDKFRGRQGCFSIVHAGIKRALSMGMRVTIGTVVTPQNLRAEGINKLVDLASGLKVILMLIPAIRIGRWRDEPGLIFEQKDLDYLDGLVLKHLYVRTDFYANYFRKGCGAVKEILYLNPYGDVFACPFIHKKLGNALSEPLSSIRDRALNNRLFKDYKNVCLAMQS